MRILALETNIGVLKKQFIAEGEKELLSSIHHIFAFLFTALSILLVYSFAIAGFVVLMRRNDNLFLMLLVSLYCLSTVCLVRLLKAFIDWRYNYIFVTTEKILVVKHAFVFHQQIRPIHFEDIKSVSTESQFFGIGHCGILYINLEEKLSGSSDQIRVGYLPKPEVIMGVIENAIVLKKKRLPTDQGLQDQMQTLTDVKEKAEEQQGGSAATPGKRT